ncbi:hypothetical protein [Neptunomonas japonica]|uniref:hypothetical protein n=1 Tax=Neptunomonas japonica TaxID=417574 RepID=UPI001915D49F|nr:hypothetical protein [Neptunomonas japonica]
MKSHPQRRQIADEVHVRPAHYLTSDTTEEMATNGLVYALTVVVFGGMCAESRQNLNQTSNGALRRLFE